MIELTPLLLGYLALVAAGQAVALFAERLNASRIAENRGRVPAQVEEWIDADRLARMERYTLERARFGRIRSVVETAVFVVLLVSGLLPWLAGRLSGGSEVLAGLVFFAVIGGLLFAVGLPFDYHAVFAVEERHGFNTRSLGTWVADTVKGAALSAAIFSVLLCAVLVLIRHAGMYWWIAAWVVAAAFQIGLALVYPTLIAPIFNTFTPVKDEDLRGRILALADRAGIRVRRIDQMDASKRTRHTNAYFAGLGKTRSIVLYDSLLAAHDPDEVLSILAHEIGHLKKRHIPKQLALLAASGLVLFAAAGMFIAWPGLYTGFGFSVQASYVGLFLAGIILQAGAVFLSPVPAALSRRFEREADQYVGSLVGSSAGLCRALKKMAADNLTNLYPHPFYVALYYSHPPILERLERLGCVEKGK